jgi:hypothetical protein
MMHVRRNGGERLHQRGDHDHRATLRVAIARDGHDRRRLRRRQLPVPGAGVLPGRPTRRLQTTLARMGHRHHGRRVSTISIQHIIGMMRDHSDPPLYRLLSANAKPLPPKSNLPLARALRLCVRVCGSIAIFARAIKLSNRSLRGDSGDTRACSVFW